MGLVVKWLAEVYRNWAVMGSFSPTSKFFFLENRLFFKMCLVSGHSEKKELSENPYSPISATLLDQA